MLKEILENIWFIAQHNFGRITEKDLQMIAKKYGVGELNLWRWK